jgi:hypothetical protein
MAKMPYIAFYPGDWLKDADVRRCSIFARGLLVDLLCLCHEAKHRGRLCEADGITPWSDMDIVNAISGGVADEKLAALREIEAKGVLSRDENGCLYSRRMVKDEEVRALRVESGSKGGKQTQSKRSSKSEANSQANTQANIKQIPEDEIEYVIEDKKEKNVSPKKRFTPPTLAEVAAYCQERGGIVDPHAFVDHYTANGWMVGKTPMKDWRASVRTWERNSRDGPQRGGGKNPSDPRGNFATLENYLNTTGDSEDGPEET